MVRKYNLICSCFLKYKKQHCTILIDKGYASKDHNIRKIIHNRKHVCYFNGYASNNYVSKVPLKLNLKNPYISNL